MHELCPYLLPGRHYASTVEYAVVVQRAIECFIPIYGHDLKFYAGEQLLGTLSRQGCLTILPGYACDGYSPVRKIFKWWWRITPTPSCGMFPSILHDFLRQFLWVTPCPWSRKQSDDCFYNAMIAGGAENLAGIYHGAVASPLGTLYMSLSKTDPTLRIIEV